MTMKNPKAQGRPTEQTPYGELFADTEAYALYVEMCRIRDWLKTFLADMEHLRIDAPAAIKRIDEFWITLRPEHGGLKTEQLARIRASLSGNTGIHLGQQMTALRLSIGQHWDYSAGCAAQVCERPPAADERPYDGPVPRASGDQTPAFGYHRALASGHY